MSLIFSRPDKINHIDPIRYEIDMLRFTAQQLAEKKTERDAWVYLESFLLHYRSLIDFLGSEKPRPTDLHVTTIWQLENLVPPMELDEIYAKGQALRARYEPTDAQGGGRISQYLQHCTMKRIDPKDWQVSTMFNDIEPLLCEVEKHLGTNKFVLAPISALGKLDHFSASTTVATFTASAVRLINDSTLLESVPL